MRILLEAAALSKSYGGRSILSGVSIAAGTGVVGVAGPNGSGKTTLLKILAGLVRPDSGRVVVTCDGRRLDEDPLRRAIGFAGPDLAFYEDFTAAENLGFFLRAGGEWLDAGGARRRLESVGLSESADLRVSAFSSGMMQRLRLAFAGLFDPPILLLDEPMTALDAPGREIAARLIDARRRDGVVVIASNDPKDLEKADALVDLSRGSPGTGGPR